MIRPLRSTRITRLHRYYEAVCPCAPLRYSAPRGFSHLGFSQLWTAEATKRLWQAIGVGTTGSHVPHQSLSQARAASMPDTAWAINRHLPG
jgi:hypothetical protein